MPVITLPDSRRLEFELLGAPTGLPIVVLHGTPGSWRQLAGLDRPARERGLAIIAPAGPVQKRRWISSPPSSRSRAHIWHGTADRNVPVAHARVIAARCPSARLQIVDGGGHMLLSELDRVLEAVT